MRCGAEKRASAQRIPNSPGGPQQMSINVMRRKSA
jgi:hypothetical protein